MFSLSYVTYGGVLTDVRSVASRGFLLKVSHGNSAGACRTAVNSFNSKRMSFHVALELEHMESVDLRSEIRKADAVLPVFARAGQRSDTLKRVARRGRCRLLFLLGVQHISGMRWAVWSRCGCGVSHAPGGFKSAQKDPRGALHYQSEQSRSHQSWNNPSTRSPHWTLPLWRGALSRGPLATASGRALGEWTARHYRARRHFLCGPFLTLMSCR